MFGSMALPAGVEWLILFAVSWVLFFLLVDWRKLIINIWSGFIAVIMQLCIDTQFIGHNLYAINNPIISILGSSVFFVAGPVFVIGTLMAQYHPSKRWAIFIYVIAITALFSAQEYLLLQRSALVYKNWYQVDSLGVNLSAIGLLSWFSLVLLNKGRRSRR